MMILVTITIYMFLNGSFWPFKTRKVIDLQSIAIPRKPYTKYKMSTFPFSLLLVEKYSELSTLLRLPPFPRNFSQIALQGLLSYFDSKTVL